MPIHKFFTLCIGKGMVIKMQEDYGDEAYNDIVMRLPCSVDEIVTIERINSSKPAKIITILNEEITIGLSVKEVFMLAEGACLKQLEIKPIRLYTAQTRIIFSRIQEPSDYQYIFYPIERMDCVKVILVVVWAIWSLHKNSIETVFLSISSLTVIALFPILALLYLLYSIVIFLKAGGILFSFPLLKINNDGIEYVKDKNSTFIPWESVELLQQELTGITLTTNGKSKFMIPLYMNPYKKILIDTIVKRAKLKNVALGTLLFKKKIWKKL